MAKLNYIMLEELESEKDKLTNDFEEMKKNMQKVEVELNQMKNNLNALAGAIQLTNKLIESAKTQEYDEEQEMNRLTDKFKETKE
jgi:chromosome segregation ATPase